MPFRRLAETRIRQAIDDGEFDNLPNAGQPLDLDEYFRTPAELRMAYSVLKNANCVPIEVELLNDIARLERTLVASGDQAEQAATRRKIAERQMELALRLERRRKGER